MDYFAGLDISMDGTHVCVLDREGVVVRESKTESTAEAIAGELAKAPTCRRIVVRDRTHGADPVSWVEPAWSPSGLCRKPAGLPGAQVTRDPQDRSRPRKRPAKGQSSMDAKNRLINTDTLENEIRRLRSYLGQ